MILWFDDDWIQISDYPSFRVWQLLRENRVLEALPFIIKAWSADVPVNLQNCMRLKAVIKRTIIAETIKSFKELSQIDEEMLMRRFKDFIKHPKSFTRPNPTQEEWFNEIINKYSGVLFLMIDHKGNINNLPEEGSLLDQPMDWLLVMRTFKSAFIQYLNEEARRQSRSPTPKRR